MVVAYIHDKLKSKAFFSLKGGNARKRTRTHSVSRTVITGKETIRIRSHKMKTIKALGLTACLVLLAVQGAPAVQQCQDCTGTSNCNAAQADDCRSHMNVLTEIWSCVGECVKSSAAGTVATCAPGGGLFSTCPYNGASACAGVIQRADCVTTPFPAFPAGTKGSYCTGACAGFWTTKYNPGVINNCT